VGDYWEIISFGRGIKRVTKAKEIIDCTGDSDIVRLLGLGVLWAEERQPGAYEYKIERIEHGQLFDKEVQTLYEEAMNNGILKKGDFAYSQKTAFIRYLIPGGHNATHIYDSDTSDAHGQTRANLEGRERMLRMFTFVRTSIPGCERAELKLMYPYALARETYRTEGEYIVTKDDFLKARDFKDKVCNAFNYIDLHCQKHGFEDYYLESKDLLPKVPFRSLIPKGSSRITVAGRVVSADRMAHAAIRSMCNCMAMGQAMGAAAALGGVPSREIDSKDIVALTIEHGAVRP